MPLCHACQKGKWYLHQTKANITIAHLQNIKCIEQDKTFTLSHQTNSRQENAEDFTHRLKALLTRRLLPSLNYTEHLPYVWHCDGCWEESGWETSQENSWGNFPRGQLAKVWAPNAGGQFGPGQRTGFYLPQLRVCMPQLKDSHATVKSKDPACYS